ncbi:vicilin-like seed storage protein At2g18540, partial [Homalodisca vitripennis]|uniref:vicilin-like seed storage protein At2g18540 n=1 Tax=Homalodisca vitripennis TaxID=197043 RepID=UPI001EEA51E2
MVRSSKLSAKEKYERQKALTKERQRRYRERMSEEKKEEKRKYDRDRLARLKAENKIKKISDMTPREQRKMRKYWKERNLVRSLKNKSLKEVTDTPPASPLQDVREESEQKRRGRKKIRRDKAKAYRTIAKQQEKIKELEKKLGKYKKRLHREKKKNLIDSSPSPRKEVIRLDYMGCVRDLILPEQFATNIVSCDQPTARRSLRCGLSHPEFLEKLKEAINNCQNNTPRPHVEYPEPQPEDPEQFFPN